MPLSRRNLLRNIGAGAIVGAAAPALRGFPLPPAMEEALWGNSVPARPARAAGSVAVEPVLLYRNENPYGPSEKVLAVLRESAASGNRYPRTEYDTLLDQLAALHKVKREQIVLGCGSGEILCMAAMAFLKPGKKLVEAAPTFPALGKLAQTAGIEVADVPLNKRYEHDLPTMLDRTVSTSASSGSAGTGLVYIVNPNNPTGTLTPRKDIEAFIAKLPAGVTVLIDEAYHHFVAPGADYESFLDRPIGDPRIIVARTFSKIFGLAGMRIGYAVATPETAKRLAAGFPGWSVSVVSARGLRRPRRRRLRAPRHPAQRRRPPGIPEASQRAQSPPHRVANQFRDDESAAPARRRHQIPERAQHTHRPQISCAGQIRPHLPRPARRNENLLGRLGPDAARR